MELLLDERDQPLERRIVAAAPGDQEARHTARLDHGGPRCYGDSRPMTVFPPCSRLHTRGGAGHGEDGTNPRDRKGGGSGGNGGDGNVQAQIADSSGAARWRSGF